MGSRRYGAVLSLLTRRPRDVPTHKARSRGADWCRGYHVVRCDRDQPEELGWSGSRARWARRSGCTRSPRADVAGLKSLIEERRGRAERTLGQAVAVRVCYEAGYEGFWLARWLEWMMGLETVVLDPASLLVNRKAKQRKTDRIDATKMVRAPLAYDRGDAAVLSRVRVPTAGSGDDRSAKLGARLRYAPPAAQLGRDTGDALTFEPDQSTGAGHGHGCNR